MAGDFFTGDVQTAPPDDGQSGYVTPTGPLDNFADAYKGQVYANSQFSDQETFNKVRDDRDAAVVQLTGKPLPDLRPDLTNEDPNTSYVARKNEYDRIINATAQQHPDQVFTDDELPARAYAYAREAQANQQNTAGAATFGGDVGGFVGSTAASFNPAANPLNVLTLPLGFGKTIATRILANTALAGGTEAINEFTGVADWRKEAGLGADDPMAAIAQTALGGALFSGAGELVGAGLGRLIGKPIEDLQKMRAGKQTTPMENSMIAQAETNLASNAIGRLPDDKILSMAQQWMQEAGGTSDQRAAVHALDEELQTRNTVPYDASQPGALMQHESRLQDTVNRITDPEGKLQDDGPQLAPKITDDAFTGKMPTDELVDVKDLALDPSRFQFKSDTDAAGANETLKGIQQWNPSLAGTITVFQDDAGKMFVADGHQRVNLAKRLVDSGAESGIKVRANVLREGELANSPLGQDFRWTPESASAYAASVNMIQGTGSIADAAKVLRFKPDYLAELSNNALTRDAQGLAKLSDDAFGMVVNNSAVNESYAALVGRLVPDAKLHAPILGELLREEPENLVQAESMVRQMRDAGHTTTTQDSLFGPEVSVESLWKPKAKVLDRAMKLLRDDKKLFASLAQNSTKIESTGANSLDRAANASTLNAAQQALHNVQTLAYRKGEIADALTAAARKAQADGNFPAAAREFAESIRQSVARGDADGDASGLGSDVASPGATQSEGADRLATSSREIAETLSLDTDRLASEAGLESAVPAAKEPAADPAPDATPKPTEAVRDLGPANPAEDLDREIPVGVDIDPNTGEIVTKNMTVRDIAAMIADDDALAKYSRECAI